MIKLGELYKDRITSFEGIAIAKTEYLNGCVSVLIKPQGLTKDGGMKEGEWIDSQNLIDNSKIEVGGPGPTPPPYPTPRKE